MKKLLIICLIFGSLFAGMSDVPTCFSITDAKNRPITDSQVLIYELKGSHGQIKEKIILAQNRNMYCFERNTSNRYAVSIEKAGFEPIFGLYEPDSTERKHYTLTQKTQ